MNLNAALKSGGLAISTPSAPNTTATQVIKQVPNAALKVAKNIGNFATSVAQSIPRTALSVAMGITGEKERVPTGPVERKLLGSEPVKPIAQRVAENELATKDFLPNGLKGAALPIAFAGTIAGAALDLFPGSAAEKSIASKLVKNPDDIQIMKQFIDYARLGKKAGPINHALELDAARIAEHYGITKNTKTTSALANEFDKHLTNIHSAVEPKFKPSPLSRTTSPSEFDSAATIANSPVGPQTALDPAIQARATAIANKSQQLKGISYDGSIAKPPTDVQSVIHTPPAQLKDISNVSKGMKDVYRNFETVYGKEFFAIKQNLLDPFDAAKGRYVDEQKTLLDDLKTNVVEKLGITKHSKESAAVQQFGENNRTAQSLVKEFGNDKAQKIVEADKWFRAKYDQLLEDVNKVRSEIYPNKPEKIIPKRKDYYRHFQELSDSLPGLQNIFESLSGIDSKLSGISPFTKPKTKFAGFMQRRLGQKTTEDAVGGFLNYVPSATYAKHIDPEIPKFRNLAKQLADDTVDTKNVNNFIDYLHKFSNDLAGKTNDLDRVVADWIPGGRTTLKALDWVNKRVKSNTILGNASSSIAQIFNVPQGLASAKQYSAPGAARTVADIFNKNAPIKASNFIKERYFKSAYNEFDTKFLEQAKGFAGWITGVLDEVGTKFIWNSHYEKALAKKVADPVKYADDITRKLVAGRGIGEVPLLQKSKLFQLVAPFQLEVANLWHVQKDFVNAKDFGAIATLFVANYVMNKGAEKIRGSAVTLDPIQATIDAIHAYQDEDDHKVGAARAAGRLAGEVLSNVPGGQTAAALYPEYGMKVGDENVTRKELFGRKDPTRFGGGLLVASALKDPASKLLPPFGGVQAKKTYEGLKAYQAGEVTDKSGKKQFDVPSDLKTVAQSAVFGKYSTPEARASFDQQKSEFDKASAKRDKEAEKAKQDFAPTYKNIRGLVEAGKEDEAKQALDSLSDEDYAIYKKMKTAEKTKNTNDTKERIYPTFKKIRELVKGGNEAEAKRILDGLTDDEYHAYKLLKEQYQ